MADRRFTRDELLTAPERFAHERRVAFQDVDAAGIVFYPRFFEYFHDAYAEFLLQHDCALHEAIAKRIWAAPLKHAAADFLRPLRFGDPIQVVLVRGYLFQSDVTLGYRIRRNDANAEVVAVGQTVHVVVDPLSFKRTNPYAAFVKAMATLEA